VSKESRYRALPPPIPVRIDRALIFNKQVMGVLIFSRTGKHFQHDDKIPLCLQIVGVPSTMPVNTARSQRRQAADSLWNQCVLERF
jgi:hypothetical protein